MGCQWDDERGDLDQHLSESSVEGERQFVVVVTPVVIISIYRSMSTQSAQDE